MLSSYLRLDGAFPALSSHAIVFPESESRKTAFACTYDSYTTRSPFLNQTLELRESGFLIAFPHTFRRLPHVKEFSSVKWRDAVYGIQLDLSLSNIPAWLEFHSEYTSC